MNPDVMRTSILTMAAVMTMFTAAAMCSAESVEPAAGASMTIAGAGKPLATIVVSSQANEVVQEAVKDLQMYVEKMSGAKLPIVDSSQSPAGNLILVGRTPTVEKLIPDLDARGLGHDGFIIKSLPGKLILAGKSDGHILGVHGPIGSRTDCGTPNAIYHFLESLGCRWYMPGDDGEVVPSRTTIEIPPLDVTSKPDVAGRWIGDWAAGRMGAFYAKYVRWLARLGAGCNTYNQGHGMYGLLPRKTFAASHPEYFALVDGKRHTAEGAQFCLSNTDVVNIVSKKVVENIAAHGPYRSYALGQYDAWGWCECQPCQALYGDKTFVYKTQKHARHVGRAPGNERAANTANGYLKFVNAVAAKTAKTYPNAMLTYLALYNIPGFPDVKASDNVLPVMCHIAPKDKYWRQEVQQWEAISKHLYYRTYMGYSLDFLKLEIADDIRWCYEHKGIAIYLEHDAHSPINAISQYLAAKAMWDTQIDSKKTLAEFYSLYYGAAEEPMRKFYEAFYAVTREVVRDYDCFHTYPPELTLLVASQCRAYITQARTLARQPVVARRIETISRYWRATELHVTAQEAMTKWRQDKGQANRDAAKTALQATIDYINSPAAAEFFLPFRMRMLTTPLGELAHGHPTLYEDAEEVLALPITWDFKTDPTDAGLTDQWFGKEVDATWQKIRVDADWRSQAHDYYGVAWYHTDFRLPGNIPQGTELTILFGAIDGAADIFLDGEKIGELKVNTGEMWNKPLGVALPAGLDRNREHHLTVRVEKRILAAGIWQPVKIVKAPK